MNEWTVEALLQTPYWIIDILPERVPENSPGQYFAIAEYYRKEPRRADIRRKMINLILKLNCYRSLSLDEGKAVNPSPERIAETVEAGRAVILLEDALLIAEEDDHYMTLYHPDKALLELISALAAGEGLFVWKGE